MTEAKPKRRWFRFSLRTLLVLMTVLCVWIGIQVNSARRQREAVAAILKAGGTVAFDYQVVRQPLPTTPGSHWLSSDTKNSPPGPAWLRRQIGDDYFRTVAFVYFHMPNRTIDKTVLDQLVSLPQTEQFLIQNCDIRDTDLTALKQLHQLTTLQIVGVRRINGSILASLPNPGRLTNLALSETDVNDEAMEYVGKMTMLLDLFLRGTQVTDAGLEHLQNLTNLEFR